MKVETNVKSGFDFPAGVIVSNDHAKTTCPAVCKSQGGWDGNWASRGNSSVCSCIGPVCVRFGAKFIHVDGIQKYCPVGTHGCPC